MKKMTNKLIPPAMRLILLISMSSAFLPIADASHSPTYVNVWIEKDGTSTKYDDLAVTVCCGEPQYYLAKTTIDDAQSLKWNNVTKVTSTSGSTASVVHNYSYPKYVNDPDHTKVSESEIIFKSRLNDYQVWTSAYSYEFGTVADGHSVVVTSVGARFKHFDEDTGNWATVAPNVNWNQTPYYLIEWKENSGFDVKTRLSHIPSSPIWELYKESSSGSYLKMGAGSIVDGYIDFALVSAGNYRVVMTHDMDAAAAAGCVPALDLDIVDLDLEASEYAVEDTTIPIGDPLPWILSSADEETVGMKVAVNNDDDNYNEYADGMPDMLQTGAIVSGENDSASVRIKFPGIDGMVSGTVTLLLQGLTQFGRLWFDRFDKTSQDQLLLAKTSGTTVAPTSSNANIGFNDADWGVASKTWDLSDPDAKTDLKNIISSNEGIFWFEGLSSGTGSLQLSYKNSNGKKVFEDKILITVVHTKTLEVRVGYSAAVSTAKFGEVTRANSVRNYHGHWPGLPDDVILPIAFRSVHSRRDENGDFDTVNLSANEEQAVFDYMRSELNELQIYVIKTLTDSNGTNYYGIAEPDTLLPLFIIRATFPDELDSTAVHEYGHNMTLRHICSENNFMFSKWIGDDDNLVYCDEFSGHSELVQQSQYDALMK